MGGNQSMSGRNGGNYSRGFPPSQMSNSGGRGYYDQMSSPYLNQSQQYYHHQNPQVLPQPLRIDLSYHNNRHQPSSGPRQKLNNNRNYREDESSRNGKRLPSATSSSSYDISSNTVSSGMLIRENSLF
jgi:hypothetical protein